MVATELGIFAPFQLLSDMCPVIGVIVLLIGIAIILMVWQMCVCFVKVWYRRFIIVITNLIVTGKQSVSCR